MDSGSRRPHKDLGGSLLPALLNNLSSRAIQHLSLDTLLWAVRCRLSISNLLLAVHIRSRQLRRRATALRLRVMVRLLRATVRRPGTRSRPHRRSEETLSRG